MCVAVFCSAWHSTQRAHCKPLICKKRCCIVLQCIAVCWGVLRCVAQHAPSPLWIISLRNLEPSEMRHITHELWCGVLQYVVQHVAVCVAVCCNATRPLWITGLHTKSIIVLQCIAVNQVVVGSLNYYIFFEQGDLFW